MIACRCGIICCSLLDVQVIVPVRVVVVLEAPRRLV